MSRTSISAAGMRIMRLLIGHPPQTMNDLIRSTGVTRTAITEQINELIDAGFVKQTMERLVGRGRPRFLYSATELALKQLFEGNQSVVVPAIWRAIRKYCDHETLESICNDVAQEVADQFCAQISSENPKERLRQFYSLISGTERLTRWDEKPGSVAVSKLSCPFITMYDETQMICRIDRLTMSKIVGADIQLVASRHDPGNTCCTFQLLLNEELEQLEEYERNREEYHISSATDISLFPA